MPLDFYFNVAATGLLTGLVYGLAALGLSVIFGVTRIVNFAHGEFMVAAMFAAVFAHSMLGLDPIAATFLLAPIWFLIGAVLERVLVHRFVGAPEHRQFILMVGIAIMLVNGQLMAFGPDARGVFLDYAFDSIEIGPLLIDKVRLYAGAASLAAAGLLFLFFRLSLMGTAIRACADNPLGAQVIGLDTRRLYAVAFGLGTALVAIAGCLLVLIADVRPQIAPEYTLLAFVVVIVGGLGSSVGALLGGMVIGLSEAMASVLLAPSMKSMLSYAILVLVLLVRPNGLMGRPT